MKGTLLSLGLVALLIAGAVFFAKWFLARSTERREQVVEEDARRDARERVLTSGGGADSPPPLFTSGSDLAAQILNDGFASNSQYVDADFRREFWKYAETSGMAVAFRRAMYARCWRRGSQTQVYDRLKSHGLISTGEKRAWKAAAIADFPPGAGPMVPPTCNKVPVF